MRSPRVENVANIYNRVRVNIAARTAVPPYSTGIAGIDEVCHGYPEGKVTAMDDIVKIPETFENLF